MQTQTHITAPISAERIRVGLITFGSTIPFPIVFATCTPKIKNAAKFQKAAHITAAPGERTLVETIVAIEFAASFMPLRKSKSNAIKIATITTVNMADCLC